MTIRIQEIIADSSHVRELTPSQMSYRFLTVREILIVTTV